MDDEDNVIYLFGKDELDDALFRQVLNEFVEHVKESKDFEETCRTYISIAARAWIQKIGYDRVRQNLFSLIVALDEKGEFD